MKKSFLLLFSLILNVVLLLFILSYVFTPYWDAFAINTITPRFCEHLKEKGSVGDIKFEDVEDNLCSGF